MVHCVDGGIAYDGIMLKYDGGSRPMITERVGHSDTSPKMIYQQQKKQREKENNKDKVERIILQTTADKNRWLGRIRHWCRNNKDVSRRIIKSKNCYLEWTFRIV